MPILNHVTVTILLTLLELNVAAVTCRKPSSVARTATGIIDGITFKNSNPSFNTSGAEKVIGASSLRLAL
jgi:hypothetical protein